METIGKEDICEALKHLGIEKSDTLLIHSFVGAFGIWKNGLKDILAAFQETVPQGTLLFPTYNYDFCKGTPYDHERTPSQVGQLTEFARTQPDFKRVLHPVYSHAVWGQKQDSYCNDPSTSGFGNGTVFERLKLDPDAKLLFFGVNWNLATFIHHVEESLNVPYRFIKDFPGILSVDGKTIDYEAQIFSRYLELNTILNLRHFEKIGKKIELGRGVISTVRVLDFYNFAVEGYQKNPFFFLAGDPWSKL